MNVLFVSSNSPYSELNLFKGAVGGAEINLRLIAEELRIINHNSYYFSTKKGIPTKNNINGVITYHYPNVYIPIVHKYFPFIKKLNKKIIYMQKIKYMEKIIKDNKIDLIHTYSTYPDTFLSIKAAEKYNIPIVQRIAGKAWYNLVLNNPSLKEKIEYTFYNVDMLLFNSDFIKNQSFIFFRELGFNVNTPFKIIDIGINYNQIKNIDLKMLKLKYNVSNDQNIIFCVESFKYYSKRQDILIKAIPHILDKFNDIKVIFAGDGINIEQMKQLSKHLGINNNIHFLGKIPHKDVLGIMSIAKIIVHPTQFEGHSTVMKEAFALGKAFLTSKIDSMKNVITNGNNAILTENDPEKFSKKIIFLLENEQIRKNLGKNAAQYAKNNFFRKFFWIILR
jgi:glycosyltransferase involved in cell wall biosynthesis